MINYIRFFLISVFLCFFQVEASANSEYSSPVKVSIIQEEEVIQAGRPFWIGVQVKLEEGWHVYWKNPGDAGIPLKVEWNLPAGFELSPLQWPFPEKFEISEMLGFGYSGEVILLTRVTPPKELLNNQTPLNIGAEVKWLVCSALTCQPGSANASLPLKISNEVPQKRAEFIPLFEEARKKIPQTHIEVKSIRKDGIVQIEVPHEEKNSIRKETTIQQAYFFPEEKNVIDHSIEPVVNQSSKEPNRYLVNLKGSDEVGAKSQSLKGVLVVHTLNGFEEKVQAFDVDSPIEDEDDQQFFSLLDGPLFSVGSKSPSIESSSTTFEGGLALALGFAFLGGMILNLMPCVLPVISFKVMSFIKMAGQSRSLTIKHGLAFSWGVILSFWVLASVMYLFRVYGQAVGWGFQLQEPLFVVILASLLFIFALSLFGVFEWGMFLASWAGQTQAESKESGYIGSFLSGILATAVATPCTGPFLGSAVGFAVTLPFFQSLSIFTFLALGMCFPYLLLACFPSLLRFMPKPGAWMETFKQLMAFILLATVLWLMWVFSAQTDTFSLLCLIAGFFCFSIGAWIYGKGCTPIASRNKKIVSYAFVALFAWVGVQTILFPKDSWYNQANGSTHSSNEWVGWEDFSPERVAQLKSEGKPFIIDFTAKWCLICQANHFVLASQEVDNELNKLGVVKLKADWTKNDPVITEELSKYGRNSVPLYVLHGGSGEQGPLILPQVLTKEVIFENLEQVKSDIIALK